MVNESPSGRAMVNTIQNELLEAGTVKLYRLKYGGIREGLRMFRYAWRVCEIHQLPYPGSVEQTPDGGWISVAEKGIYGPYETRDKLFDFVAWQCHSGPRPEWCD
jgi:hypothetical protein